MGGSRRCWTTPSPTSWECLMSCWAETSSQTSSLPTLATGRREEMTASHPGGKSRVGRGLTSKTLKQINPWKYCLIKSLLGEEDGNLWVLGQHFFLAQNLNVTLV